MYFNTASSKTLIVAKCLGLDWRGLWGYVSFYRYIYLYMWVFIYVCTYMCDFGLCRHVIFYVFLYYKQQVGRHFTSPLTLVHIIQKILQGFHSKLNTSEVRSFINSLFLVSQNSEVFFLCLKKGKC